MDKQLAQETVAIDIACEPSSYRHWRVVTNGTTATVTLSVDPHGGVTDDYELKLNSYDLAVDIELFDIVQRMRFEHPEVGCVVVTGGLDRVFCAGANIQMLAGASHRHKVNFCKFTNETRLAIEDASASSGQRWLAALNGAAAGGGYELALACDEIVLVDDRSSTVSLPEVPLLGVLPGTGGLTRIVDKRKVRRDIADVFATRSEGVRGQQAVEWGLVDSVAPPSTFDEHVARRAEALASATDRPTGAGIVLRPLARTFTAAQLRYDHLRVEIDRKLGVANMVLQGPGDGEPASAEELVAAGDGAWALAICRQLDDAVLHLRFNEPALGTWILRSEGDPASVLAVDGMLDRNAGHWLVGEIRGYWKRTLKRLDNSARSLIALVEPGSCFAGTTAELVLAADRSFMLDTQSESPTLTLTEVNDGLYPMANGLTRLTTRFWGHDEILATVRDQFGKQLSPPECLSQGLVTFAPDDLDWDDEVRLVLEELAAFSPDALTGLAANLRFVGPETMETKIFARLSAWQNWIFLRPNASGAEGALRSYGTGSRPRFDPERV